MAKRSKKVIYYSDELHDDFAGTNIKQKPLGKDYRYMNDNIFVRVGTWIVYYLIALPLVFLLQKLVVRQKLVNRKLIKQCKKQGCFIYANHTMAMGDAFTGPLVCAPKKCYVIVNPDAVSIKGLRTIVKMLGAIPLASSFDESKKMLQCVKKRIGQGSAVMIYPEAHIWPYYTDIRPFAATSFKYPVNLDAPVFCITNCYQKSLLFKHPKVVSIVDGPFYPDTSLPKAERAEKLRDQVHETMCQRAKESSTYAYVKYVKRPAEPIGDFETCEPVKIAE